MPKEAYIEMVRKEFPDLAFTNVELIKKGWDHDVLVLDGTYIFRFVKEDHEVDKAPLQREVAFLNDFSKVSNLPVPYYEWVSKSGNFGGYKIIAGRELTPEGFSELSVEEKKTFVNEMARFLTVLHGTPLEKAATYGFAPYTSWAEECTERQEWFRGEFQTHVAPRMTPEQQEFVGAFAADFYYSDYEVHPVLSHFDLSHDHIVMNGHKISGIIDFGDVRIGDPAQELAELYDYDLGLPAQVYEQYGGPKHPDFMERAYKHHVHKWIYLHREAAVRRHDDALWNEAQEKLDQIIRKARAL